MIIFFYTFVKETIRKMIELSATPSKKEVCQYYEISYNTLKIWLNPIKNKLGKYRGRRFTPRQRKIILDHLGKK